MSIIMLTVIRYYRLYYPIPHGYFRLLDANKVPAKAPMSIIVRSIMYEITPPGNPNSNSATLTATNSTDSPAKANMNLFSFTLPADNAPQTIDPIIKQAFVV